MRGEAATERTDVSALLTEQLLALIILGEATR
jgi:hypothetical protein